MLHHHQKIDKVKMKLKMRKLFYLCFLFVVSFNANSSVLTQYLNKLHTLEATFTQSVFTQNNISKQKSTGIIIVKSPNNFYLEYTNPYKLIYVADGKKLWSYDEDLEQVVVKPQGNLLINTPAMLLGNPRHLTQAYHIENTGVSDGWLWFELKPKKESNNFESVSLAFKDNNLKAMEMRDNFGQTTRLEFNKVIKNPVIENNRFKFTPPKGVDVIGQ